MYNIAFKIALSQNEKIPKSLKLLNNEENICYSLDDIILHF